MCRFLDVIAIGWFHAKQIQLKMVDLLMWSAHQLLVGTTVAPTTNFHRLVFAGSDMALHLVRRRAGIDLARQIRRGIQCDPLPRV